MAVSDGGPEPGVDMDAVVEWVDVRDRLPKSGTPVAAAVVGRYPPDSEAEPDEVNGQDFWLVLPMYFTTLHFGEDGTEHHDCFVDSDRVVRLPYGRPCDEPVTHWAALPALPGAAVHQVLGEGARTALEKVWDGETTGEGTTER
ncbi:AQJ64_40280 family protein [Streptomyces ipomoeae]|uniref:AQJ64_40280 family protein n=1 Tax=Streptomyces ipomoeae TaxID=103232 RepID=UPI0029A90D5F|nr:AQJ64_40280 family protein [Streptomyces ipomoeae]MDX2879286.1 amine oxidase [Streptomyces ipomoeae]